MTRTLLNVTGADLRPGDSIVCPADLGEISDIDGELYHQGRRPGVRLTVFHGAADETALGVFDCFTVLR